jgi:hypothetical protein
MATSPELKQALKDAADTIAGYVKDVATMTVETRFVELGSDFEQSKPAALTVVRLDGDSQTVLPMKKGPDGALIVDTGLHELHQENVQAAIAYRTQMLERLLAILRGA